nr:UDP-2,3-diacylglucosamine diphosphatase [Paucibacter sp. KCTC 42545]
MSLPDATAVPAFAELTAPPAWRRIDFLSDLHLSAETPATLAALEQHLQETAADAVMLLGDIFEVWVGDDARLEDGFEAHCLQLLRAASQRLPIYFMVGNRDFLLGEAMLADSGMQPLADPTVLTAFGTRYLLTHGDALCLSDQAYQGFRAQVRQPAWQAQFLAQPLAVRRALARQMRDGSKAQQKSEHASYTDLDEPACAAWLQAADSKTMIHGHTHRPGEHALGGGLRRHVLSDWDLEDPAPRADVLRLRQAGLRRISLA